MPSTAPFLDSFKTRTPLSAGEARGYFFSLEKLARDLNTDFSRLPRVIRILIENLLRNEDGSHVNREHVEALARWSPKGNSRTEVPFMPARVLMQDFTGVPAVADLAAMRDAVARLSGDPEIINPRIPVHLVIDHSVQVDSFGTQGSFARNAEMEFARNRERYTFLKWGQKSFKNFHVVPPATGICHQVNLECLASVVTEKEQDGQTLFLPDTLVGLDSHTTMINGLGVLGWGVGGIEAEATMLGQPYSMLTPAVIGVKLSGRLPENATATDLVLHLTNILRKKGVVEKFLEFFGDGLDSLAVPDRATIANMTPEFGATTSFFPVDRATLDYLAFTGRSPARIALIEAYLTAQGLFRTPGEPEPAYSDLVEVDLSTVGPSLAGPRKPHDLVPLGCMKEALKLDFEGFERQEPANPAVHKYWEEEGGAVPDPDLFDRHMVLRKPVDKGGAPVHRPYQSFYLDHGSVVIAAITSCTNTSNPAVLLGAGLMAKKAVERGLMVRPWVKTSLAPGSRVVTDYLEAAGLLPYLAALRFQPVAYGCTTCIGNSGPLQSDVAKTVKETRLLVASVLSGNRNYEGRINPLTRANYLASPMLVIAYALAGTINIDMEEEPLGHNANNEPVFLRDIWPTRAEIAEAQKALTPGMFRKAYGNVYEGDENWRGLAVTDAERYLWEASSTYIKEPPFFTGMTLSPPGPRDISGARVLALLGDTITTDHISPAGAIPDESPAARYLVRNGVEKENFNAYGSRRGNHEVMMRGTFGNVRLKNLLAPGTEGGVTRHLPDGQVLPIYDAAMLYKISATPLIVVAGREYGSGSSRDWAAKGPLLLGVRAVIAQSFERIHRGNLVAMGILPLEFVDGQNAQSLGLTGEEEFSIEGGEALSAPNRTLTVRAGKPGAAAVEFSVKSRLDSHVEVDYHHHGGILPYVLRQMLADSAP